MLRFPGSQFFQFFTINGGLSPALFGVDGSLLNNFSQDLFLFITLTIARIFFSSLNLKEIDAIRALLFLVFHHIAVDILEAVAVSNDFVGSLFDYSSVFHNENLVNIFQVV